ncbi:DUF6261 family protein [Carboxylicivirga sp. M1479]|uniref:DUF6261 family protein n=1 Tax=Carboxylicivirga sp. M1479 TaxID=2594476 RepID=UPI001177DCAB|nr:DUF6261 family protein [Carboxylicivirga sp. M1479]TRX65968.1 hypothetical protein FNN09_15825 [Carboxylicivirga sp. M1479]
MEKVTPYFGNYNQSECIQYLLDAAALCAKPNNESLSTPLQALAQGNTKLVQAFKKDKKSNITKLLTQYDQRRDDAVVCLRMCAQAYTNHYDTEMREAAHIVLNTIDKYGKSLHKLNYQSETSVLSNLYTDCTTEPVASAVAKILMSDVVEEMNTANSLFNETYLARVEESAAKEQIATGQLVQDAIANYRHLVTFIEAYNTINPDGGYDTLLKQLSELAVKYNGLITTSETREEVEEELLD